MKHQELTDHIKGSALKKQYLEAFLVQSAYIESLLKVYVDFEYFKATEKKSYKDKILITIRKTMDRYGLNELIKFLRDSNLISDEQKKLLNTYKDKRNKILHNLINEIKKQNFEEELKNICTKGSEIIESAEIKEIAQLVDRIETPKANGEDDHSEANSASS